MERPSLTFPDDVADRVRAEYARASVVLEYGSGGSTALAAETPGLTCFSVENDLGWARAMAAWLAEHHPRADIRLHRAWTGPTKKWGRPRWPRLPLLYPLFRRYPASVWARRDFSPPDLILVDGRFRVACFLTALMHVRRPTRLLWDDYTRRPNYHVAERYCAPVAVVGRMAVFDVAPREVSPAELAGLREAMLDPE